jgi:hypothetical protein
MIVDQNGNQKASTTLEYDINEFSGFCADGTFFFVEECMMYSAWGYPNLMGLLQRATFNGSQISVDEMYMTTAKNIYFADYHNTATILNDEYLALWYGALIPLDSITEDFASASFSCDVNFDMGDSYAYIYNAGVNMVLMDENSLYALIDNQRIMEYDPVTGVRKSIYTADHNVFNIKKCGNTLLALETDGTYFYYEQIALNAFEELKTTTYNLNDQSVYKRTQADIVMKFANAAPDDLEATLYASEGSASAPYKESTLTAATKENALKISNYYRWLCGLTEFTSASDEAWSNAAKGAILLHSDFSHSPSQPEDMSDDFYNAAYKGTSSSSIAYNYSFGQYKLIYTIRQFMNDSGYTVPGHRNNFMTRNATTVAYGISDCYLCQTVDYTDNPNPTGTAVYNNDMAYTWPAAGVFPAEEIAAQSNVYWTIMLNTDQIALTNNSTIEIKDLDTGAVEERDFSVSTYWGYFISFAPPTTDQSTYAGKRYQVTVTEMTDADGLPAELTYTVDFFSYSDVVTVNGRDYYCDEYGSLTEIKNIADYTATLSYTSTTYSGTAKKPEVTIAGLTQGTDYKVSYSSNVNAGTGTVTITGINNYKGTITKTFKINAASLEGKKVTLSETSYTYDKKAHQPAVTISGLTAGTDYTVSYPKDTTTLGTKTITITGKGNYTGTVTASYSIDLPFTDVEKGTWQYNVAEYVFKRNIITGTTDTTFSPKTSLTRGQFVNILWRMEGSQSVTFNNPFPDVPAGKFYSNAVQWAKNNDLVAGYNNGKFGPSDEVSRQQFVVFLYRYAKLKGYDLTTSGKTYTACKDYKQVSGFAEIAMEWAYERGFIGASGSLAPKDSITRIEAAAILQRFLQYYGQ